MRYTIALLVLCVVGVLGYLFIYIPLQHTQRNEALPQPQTQSASEDSGTSSIASLQERESMQRVPVEDTPLHPAEGYVRIIKADKTYIRYEDFKTINGPDLFVYLSRDTKATQFVNLGALKATEGNFNYEVPTDVTLSEYPYVLVWCRAFGVLFNSANIETLLQ